MPNSRRIRNAFGIAAPSSRRRLSLIAMAIGAAALLLPFPASAQATSPNFSVGPQYDTAHVYVPADAFDTFVKSFTATFGGTVSPQGVFTVTPTPSKTKSQLALSPAGTVSVFGFVTPIPYPFGSERTGYLVTDLDAAVKSAADLGAAIVVSPFNDPIGKDAVVMWPGGIYMQLYSHTAAPHYAPLSTIPENRVYVAQNKADEFIRDFVVFSHGKVASDTPAAQTSSDYDPVAAYRRVSIESGFGKMLVIVSNGQLAYPLGRETTGYEVADLSAALAKAASAGVTVLVAPFTDGNRRAAFVEFPGGYVAEIHAVLVNPVR